MIILRQKEYARADYEGLTKRSQKDLRKLRDMTAIGLKQVQKNANKPYQTVSKVGDTAYGFINEDAKKVKTIFPEHKESINKFLHGFKSKVGELKKGALKKEINNMIQL